MDLRFPVCLYNISISDGTLWGDTAEGEQVCLMGTYLYHDHVVQRDRKHAIPWGVFRGRMRAYADVEYEVHFKNECGVLIERPQYMELPVQLLRYNASIAVVKTALGTEVIVWQPGAMWDPAGGHYVGHIGSTLVSILTR